VTLFNLIEVGNGSCTMFLPTAKRIRLSLQEGSFLSAIFLTSYKNAGEKVKNPGSQKHIHISDRIVNNGCGDAHPVNCYKAKGYAKLSNLE